MESLIKFVKPKFDHENFTHVLNILNKNFPCQLGKKDMQEFWELVSGCTSIVSVKERFQAINKVVMSIDSSQEDLDDDKIKRIIFALQLAVKTILDIKDNDEILTTIFHKENKNLTLIMPFCHVDYNVLRKELREAFVHVLDIKQTLEKSHSAMVNKKIYDTVFLITLPLENLQYYCSLNIDTLDESNSISVKNLLNGKYKNIYSLLSFNSIDEKEIKIINKNIINKKISAKDWVAKHIKEKVGYGTELLSELIGFLDHNRCTIHGDFLDIGQCIFNITHGSDTGLSFWCDISKQSNKHNLCIEQWKFFKQTNTTIDTFMYWCSQDDPEGYVEWKNQSLETLLWCCLDPTASYTEIAELLYQKYKHKFVFYSHNNKQGWYMYEGQYYKQLDNDNIIRTKLSNNLVRHFNNILNECNTCVEQAPNGSEKDKWYDKQDKCIKIIKNLKTPSHKSIIMNEACEKFYNPDFGKQIAQNKMLFCFNNGVFDCNTCYFRSANCQDINLISCGYDYKEYSWEDPDVKFCMEYLEKVFVDKEIREYFITYCSSFLEAGNKDKIFAIFSGMGKNSKYMVELLLESCFGCYLVKTRKNKDNSKINLDEKIPIRIKVLQENWETDQLDNEISKQLRENKTILVCNKIPRIDNNNIALINSLRVINFESTFSHTYPDTIEEQFEKKIFPLDPVFYNKISSMTKPFMWILVQKYSDYKKNGLVTPESVIINTDKYKISNDIYRLFICKMLEVADGEETKFFVKSDQLYQTFKLWFKDNFPSTTVPVNTDFEYNLYRKGLKIENMRCYGVKIRSY